MCVSSTNGRVVIQDKLAGLYLCLHFHMCLLNERSCCDSGQACRLFTLVFSRISGSFLDLTLLALANTPPSLTWRNRRRREKDDMSHPSVYTSVATVIGARREGDGSPGQKPHAAQSGRGEQAPGICFLVRSGMGEPDSLLIGIRNYEPEYKSSRFQATTCGPAPRACLRTSFSNPPAATYNRIASGPRASRAQA
jgi:hypothetical protein